jgi:hypothetical protein
VWQKPAAIYLSLTFVFVLCVQWISPWPIGCEGDDCERGEYTFWVAVFGAIIFQVLAFIIISISNILIFSSLRNQEKLMARYQGGGENRFSREAAVQGFLYSAAALNTVFWGFLSLFLGTFSDLNDGVRQFIAIMVSIVISKLETGLIVSFF